MMNSLKHKQEECLFPKRVPLVVNGTEIDLVRCPHLLVCGKENLSAQITDLCRQLIHHKGKRYHQLHLCDPGQSIISNLSEKECDEFHNVTTDQPAIRQALHLILKDAKERYGPLKATRAIDIFDFNRQKEWEEHLVSTIHPEYLGGLWGSERELFMRLPRKIVIIANLETALAVDQGNTEKLLRIVEIGRAVGAHVIAALSDLDSLPAGLLEHFSVSQLGI